MKKSLTLKGLSATPTPYASTDGYIADGINFLADETTETMVLPQPHMVCAIEDERYQAAYIHACSDGDIFLYTYIEEGTGDQILLYSEDGYTRDGVLLILRGEIILHYGAIGNILIVLSQKGIHYLRYKNRMYTYLGTHLPEIPVSLGLQGEIEDVPSVHITYDKNGNEIERTIYDLDTLNGLLAQANTFQAEKTKEGRFVQNFYCRTALRLYDGSYVMHSVPVYMTCNSNGAPICNVAMVCDLDYAVAVENSVLQAIKERWEGLILSVDIFVSAPIYIHKTEGDLTTLSHDDINNCYSICKYQGYYQKISLGSAAAIAGKSAPAAGTKRLPLKTIEERKRELESISTFYLLKRIPLSELTTTRTKIDIPKDYLTALEAREYLNDDFHTHDSLRATYCHNYNQRLSLAGLTRKLFSGQPINTVYPFISASSELDKGVNEERRTIDPNSLYNNVTTLRYAVSIQEDNQKYILYPTQQDILCYYPTAQDEFNPNCFFFPNANAKELFIEEKRWDEYNSSSPILVSHTIYVYELKRHDFLTGAIISSLRGTIETMPTETTFEPTVNMGEDVYVSEIKNPWVFPAKNVVTIGNNGRVIALASALEALSTGQFGQYPLYAFTTNGVWALQVDSKGLYTNSTPVTRDVITSINSLCPINKSVLFATRNGIMQLVGSQSSSITQSLQDYGAPFSLTTLPHSTALLETINLQNQDHTRSTLHEFLKNCHIAYDYNGSRIFVSNSLYHYQYVYSIKSKLWGIAYSKDETYIKALNSYPQCYVASSRGMIIDLSQDFSKIQTSVGLIVTRPQALDAPDILKTIRTLVVRGSFHPDHIAVVLYGTNDLRNHYLIASSTNYRISNMSGTPYKWFTIALIFKDFVTHERVRSIEIEFQARHTNKIR